MYSKSRIDALTDGIFAVAMTLLVLDLRLPDDFHPHDADELLRGLSEVVPKVIPYLLSFMVLGLRWLSGVGVSTKAERFGWGYARWWLLYLLSITCVPFTTIVAGRFPALAPAVWLYAGNTAFIGIVSFALLYHTPQIEKDEFLFNRQVTLVFLIGTSLLAIGWTFVSPRQAMMALVLNALAPWVTRWLRPAMAAGYN